MTNFANCVPPIDPDLAKKIGLRINVNFGDMMIPLASARRQYRRAFWGSLYFFNVGLPFAPPQYQQDWQLFITDFINRKMKDSLKYFEALESVFTAIVAHGQGPRLWYDPYKWCPDFVAIEDLRIPSDTTLDFEYMEWFAVRHMYTPGALAEKAFAPNSRWAKKEIAQMLRNKKNQNWDFAANNYDWETQPEKFAELMHQDGGYYMGDAMPTFPLWHFYFLDKTQRDKAGWWMKVVPAPGAQDLKPDKFLWESNRPIAKKLSSLLHCQFGDLSGKAPATYHGIRSLGFALMEPTFYTNLTRCRLLQHLHDNFNIWLRSNDPVDRARAQVQEFANMGIVKPGLSVIPRTERHQIDPGLVEMGMAQLKQLQQEASASYTQSSDTGTKRGQTAFETSVKVEQVNAMTSGLLTKAFIYEKQNYIEICRRFCIPKSKDEDVKEFQNACKQYGIPVQMLDSKFWIIEPVTPLGNGNPTLARAAAKELLEILPLLDPTAQQEAKHEIVLTITNDPRKAARWVPLGKNRGITDAQRDSQAMFGTLMQGVPVPPREGLPAIDQYEALEPLFAGKIALLTRRDNMATPDEAVGLGNVLDYLKKLVQRVGQAPNEKQRVKQYGDSLGNLENELKGLAQRGAEKAQQGNGNGMDPEVRAKVAGQMTAAHVKNELAQQKAQQKAKMDAQRAIREERRKDAATFAQIQRDGEAAKAKNRMKSFDE